MPDPVQGHLVIDTGAQRTCISYEAAKDLGLIPVRLQNSYGAHGLQESEIFRAQLNLLVRSPKGGELRYNYETEAQGIPDLEKAAATHNLHQGGKPTRLVGLMGRDILQHAILTYNGTGGWYEVNFDLTSLMKTTQAGKTSLSPHQA